MLGDFIDALYDFGASSFDALAKVHWVMAGSNELVGFGEDVISKNSNGGSTIAGDLVELLRGRLNELSAHLVAEGLIVFVAEIDSFSDSDAIMGDGWCAVAFFDYDIAAFWTESNLHCVVKCLGAAENFLAGFVVIKNFLCHRYSL